jgi:hypothetical protein
MWRLKHNNAAGRLWRYIEKNIGLSRNHLEKVKKHKFTPVQICVNLNYWYYKDENND